MKKIAVFGSTGSIGTQTLDVIRKTKCAEILALSCNENAELMLAQINEFHPKIAVVTDKSAYERVKSGVSESAVKVLYGGEGFSEVCNLSGLDMVLNALVGFSGFIPTMQAIEAGLDIALANKETLVCGGEIIMPLVKRRGVKLIPVDSEHSAIFQCLTGNEDNKIEKIILTASGGPFRGRSREELSYVTAADALRHPNWSMGKKITIDSATMMNKGFEVIEAKWLFGVPLEKIEVVVHPQSIIHSMVQFTDGAVLAQLGEPDMRVPIQYALTYPKRAANDFPRLDFLVKNNLTFEKPSDFPCLALAYRAFLQGGAYPAVLNAANEQAVGLFLNGKIGFLDISALIESALSAYTDSGELTPETLVAADSRARAFVNDKVN